MIRAVKDREKGGEIVFNHFREASGKRGRGAQRKWYFIRHGFLNSAAHVPRQLPFRWSYELKIIFGVSLYVFP